MKEVIIKLSDKGGNVVLWPVKMHEREVMRQLRDSACYQKLTFNLTSKFQTQLQIILQEAVEKGILSDNKHNVFKQRILKWQ